ncbi:MAG: hypothetical protein HY231_24090 [Acidobacteria bacterium]|nr:hypothetical protein [Acidobacteriota bacterium]
MSHSKYSRALLLIAMLLQVAHAQAPCSQGTAYKGCKACGSAHSLKGQQLDVLKNRDHKATDVQDLQVKDMRKLANNTKFNSDMQVRVTGFVASVVPGGKQENCNCSRNDLQDIHINIVATPQERNNQRRYVIVEFTPRWQEKFGLDNNDYPAMIKAVRQQIEGRWVTFEGWMLYDYFHAGQSVSTAPDNPKDWRATPWEVHPITKYTVLPGPPH